MSVRNVVVGVVYHKANEDKQTAEGRHTTVKFLVLHRVLLWKGWEFPKGGIEKTDKEEESALRREIKEETGLTRIRIIEKLPYQIKYKYPKRYASRFKHSETIQSVYLVRSFDTDVKPTIEHDDFRWLDYKEARKLLTHKQQKTALDVAWKFLQENH